LQHSEKSASAQAMVYQRPISDLSSNGRPPSEYEILPGGRAARKSALSSSYSIPPFNPIKLSTDSEHGDNGASRPQTQRYSGNMGDLPGGFFAQHEKAESNDGSSYVVLPGGRRARLSASIDPDSRPASPSMKERAVSPGPRERAKSPSLRGRAVSPGFRERPVSPMIEEDYATPFDQNSIPAIDSRNAPALPPIGTAPTNLENYEVLPGGRVARKSGLSGHVGGFGVLDRIRNHTTSVASSEPQRDESVSGAQAPSVITASSLPHVSAQEAAPVTTPKGPTMPPNSSVKDYYSAAQIKVGDKLTAVWSYAARTRDEFDLERGDVLKVTSLWGDGWAIGVIIKEGAEGAGEHDVTADKVGGDKEAKAFPLVCVCVSEYWKLVIDAGGKPLDGGIVVT
jgi:hypothetical protein